MRCRLESPRSVVFRKLRVRLICGLILVTAIFPGGFLWGAGDAEQLSAGESRVITTDFDIHKVATGDPKICQVLRTDMREILLNAQKPGETNILIWDSQKLRQEIQVTVNIKDTAATAIELRELFKGIEGVTVRSVGSRVVVEGEVFSRNDLNRVSSILERMPDTINLVKMSPVLKQVLTKEMQKAIGIKGVTVRAAKESFLLEGVVYSEDVRERAGQIAAAYSDTVVNVIRIPKKDDIGVAQMVQLRLSVMEVDKGALNDKSFNWNPQGNIGGGGQYSGASGSKAMLSGALSGTISNLAPKMNHIQEQGRGRSLFQQTVISKSGGQARFFVGEEIPISVAQEGGVMSVEYKKVGLTLLFSPVVDARGNVDTRVEVESSFVTGQGAGGAPRVTSTQIQTVVYVKSGDSIALGGLIGQREVRSYAKAPPGGQSGGALAQLNKSKRFLRDQSEVLVFVTPEILSRPSDAVREMGTKVKKTFKEYERENIDNPAGK